MIVVQVPSWFGKEDTNQARSSVGDDEYDIASLDRALTLNVSLERRLREKVEREKIKRTLEREQFQPGVQPTQCADTQYVDAQCVDAQCVGSPSASLYRSSSSRKSWLAARST